mgnify:CR=1 FL=1
MYSICYTRAYGIVNSIFFYSYLGLLENVRVRRAGFAFRQDYTRFLQRYKMLADQTWPNFEGSEKDGVKVILQTQNLDKDVRYNY